MFALLTAAFAGVELFDWAFAATFSIRSVAGVSTRAPWFALPAAVFASEAVFVFVGASEVAGVSGLLPSTETLPVTAGIARNRADSIKVAAAAIVIFESTVAVPRGANAELETLLVNSAPASVFPGCKRTAATRTRQDAKNIT